VLKLGWFPLLFLLACNARERPASMDASLEASAPSVAASSASAVASEPAVVTPPPPPPPPPLVVDRDAAVVTALVWKTHRGDKFSIAFPGDPKLTVLPAEADRVEYREAKFDVPGNWVSLAAGYSDHTPEDVADPQKFLDDHVNAPRRGTTDVLHKRNVTIGAHPGRVLILRRNISGTALRIYSRLYLVGPRLYSLIVSTLDVGGVSEDLVKKFMDSFKLL